MQYTLITKNGKIMQFYIKSVAELYQSINGGVVLTQQTVKTEEIVQKTVDI
jgi:hypothetical protein